MTIIFGVIACDVILFVRADAARNERNNLRLEIVLLSRENDSLKIANSQLKEAWRNTIAKNDCQYDYVFFGNSLTRNSDFRHYFPKKKILNLGLGGDDLMGMAKRANVLGEISCERMYLMAGINSVERMTEQEFVEAYEVLLDSILTYKEKEVLIVQNMLPISNKISNERFNNGKISMLNEEIKNLCRRRDIEYVDIYKYYVKDGELPIESTIEYDGLHIKEMEYRKWAHAIKILEGNDTTIIDYSN